MASLSRLALLKKYKDQIDSHWENKGTNHGMDTTELQMASVDEMMSVLGFVPRILPNKPDVKDGRFGYQNIYRNGEQKFLSLEEAVSLHNGYAVMRNHYRTDPMFNNGSLSLALQTRLVDNASVQKTRDGSLVAQNRYVKFVEDKYVC